VPAKPERARRRSAIALVGAGRMGMALLKGWLANKLRPIVVVEPEPQPELRRLAKSKRISLHGRLEDIDAGRVGVCVVAIKPQILSTEAPRLRPFADAGALLVSIAAGTSTASFVRACGPDTRIIRAMPNLPGAIGKGISALYAARRATRADRAQAETLLAALGDTVWVKEEGMIDTVTAVSGSGPAYVFLMVEALAQAGEAEGLSPALAMRLARATIIGAGALLDQDERNANALRRAVTSPGGTTEAALGVLMGDHALASLIGRAVAAARRRAQELAS
jgi:pyrroline-5-carboxylate reductase